MARRSILSQLFRQSAGYVYCLFEFSRLKSFVVTFITSNCENLSKSANSSDKMTQPFFTKKKLNKGLSFWSGRKIPELQNAHRGWSQIILLEDSTK